MSWLSLLLQSTDANDASTRKRTSFKGDKNLSPHNMPHAGRIVAGAGIVAICLGLLGLNVWGLLHPVDMRSHFGGHIESYSHALRAIRKLEKTDGATPQFYRQANTIYHSAIAYRWPRGMARVRFRDNWILAAVAYLDPLIHAVGLKKNSQLFSQFESFRYERALGRGFGICSQNALGLADLLHRLFGSNIHMVGLGGHVVTQVDLPDKRSMILDPSTGVVLPFSISYAQTHLRKVRAFYRNTAWPELAATYDPAGNFISPYPGAEPYSARQYWKQEAVKYFEGASDIMIWLLPLAGLTFAFYYMLVYRRPVP